MVAGVVEGGAESGGSFVVRVGVLGGITGCMMLGLWFC